MQSTEAQQKSIRLEVIERVSELMMAALSLVAALAWNDAIQTLFKLIFGDAASVYAKFLYAILVTLAIIVISRYLLKASRVLREQLDRTKKTS